MNVVSLPNLVLLLILDGWGVASQAPGNAISRASTPNINKLQATYPHTLLEASGEAVGLPRGEAGNTETGHLNIGAGRVVYQDLAKINMSIADGSFYQNKVLIKAFDHALAHGSNLHLMGLIGAAGVHSNREHLYALIGLAKRLSFKNLYLHLFTDGRDSPPTSAKNYIVNLREVVKKEGVGTIASIMGRYWAMDRDLRWDRTAKAYFALTRGEGHLVKTPEEAIEMSYQAGKTDEFIEPSLVIGQNSRPVALIKDNDSCIFFNFRIDRPRQITSAFVVSDFQEKGLDWGFDPYLVKYEKTHLVEGEQKNTGQVFDRGVRLKNLFFVTMTEYSKLLVTEGVKVAFPPEVTQKTLGEMIAAAGLKQLRAAESEKERFVTFYFNGQAEGAFTGEERLIVPSPRVSTYDLMPQMSSRELTRAISQKIKSSDFKLVVVNFASPDMVAHTGNIGATSSACEVVDECIGELVNTVLALGGVTIITADHGNAEEMINTKTGQIDTEHNANPVPFIVVSKELTGWQKELSNGILADIAPTILKLLGLQIPDEMTGRNLLGII